jgi:retron-type reverse transcriptase
VIDLDLEKFFDRVNHDKLMGQIAKRIEDKRLLKLIRAFLNAGVMENGLVSPSVEGTPTALTTLITLTRAREVFLNYACQPITGRHCGHAWISTR